MILGATSQVPPTLKPEATEQNKSLSLTGYRIFVDAVHTMNLVRTLSCYFSVVAFILHHFGATGALLLRPSGTASGRRIQALMKLPHMIDEESSIRLSPSRRDVLVETAAATLYCLALGIPPSFAAATETASKPQTIVITGANSGIGFEACKRLASQGHRIVLACRTQDKAERAVSALSEYGGSLIPAECDLASLASIQRFSDRLPSLIDSKIDSLCLNAGLCRNTAASDVARTVDGFELTVGTNHFGHFYLNHLLLPMVQSSSGRIIVTASGVHDPESPGGAQGPTASLGDLRGLDLQGRECEMLDGLPFNADKAYKDSKVRRLNCCVHHSMNQALTP